MTHTAIWHEGHIAFWYRSTELMALVANRPGGYGPMHAAFALTAKTLEPLEVATLIRCTGCESTFLWGYAMVDAAEMLCNRLQYASFEELKELTRA